MTPSEPSEPGRGADFGRNRSNPFFSIELLAPSDFQKILNEHKMSLIEKVLSLNVSDKYVLSMGSQFLFKSKLSNPPLTQLI